jgi:hypothetical protein
MVKTKYADLIEDAKATLEAWKNVDPALKIGELGVNDLETRIQQAAPIQAQMDSLEAQLTNLRNQRDTLYEAIWGIVKRLRAGVKGIYGDDSSQYEMVGGTRLSERKPRAKKKG